MGRMMINSDNEDTNSIQELFGSGTPSVGRAAMNQTAWNVVGMSNSTALQHKFNCGNTANNPYNTLTLADAGLLYEQTMTNDAVLPEPERTTFRQIMLNEVSDNRLRTAINAIIDQEAALIEMPAADIQGFKNGLLVRPQGWQHWNGLRVGCRLGEPAGQQRRRCPAVRLWPLRGRGNHQYPAQLRRAHGRAAAHGDTGVAAAVLNLISENRRQT